jgi:hypothetical protein
VPQAGTTAALDSLGDKLMYPLYYRNDGGTESLWVSHTVNNNQGGTGPTGIRWYQFNVTGGTLPAGAVQQQTFTNGGDGLFRWMPSLALDSSGNLSIGYSASSGSTNPSIRYAGRLAADPLSSLAQGEAVLIQGAGSQTSSISRWGDYSATAVDVADGCTFWHTNEYYASTSAAHWNTRIGAFKFANCGQPVATSFYTLTPCRLIDTRNAVGPYGGPSLVAGTSRIFLPVGQCGIPATAKSVAVNIVVVSPTTGPGHLTVYPAGAALPGTSTLNYVQGDIRANNAIIPLGAAGDIAVFCAQGSGTADLVIDTVGYFQ